MKKFIKHLLLFSLPILIFTVLFELLLRYIPNDYSYKKNFLDTNSNKIEILFLGSSHIYFGINPKHLSRRSFNGAHISQSLNFDLAILKKYETRFKNLKYLILPMDYISMYSSIENGSENWRVKNYAIYYRIFDHNNFWSVFEIFNGKLISNILRTKSYLIDGKSDLTCNNLGFGTNYNSKKSLDLIETGVSASERHTIDLKKNKLIFYKNSNVIKSFISFSKKHSLKIIFITCPAYSTYRDNLNQIQLSKTISFIKSISKQNPNVFYFNFLNDKNFIAKDFFDADHLNELGAKKLTLKIDSILKKSL